MASKKLLTLGIVLCLTMPMVGCGGLDNVSSTSLNLAEKMSENNPYETYKNDFRKPEEGVKTNINTKFAFYWLNENVTSQFNKERRSIEEIENNQDLSLVNVVQKEDKTWQRERKREDPLVKGQFAYKGEMKDNKPEGWGIIYFYNSSANRYMPWVKGYFESGKECKYSQIYAGDSIDYEGEIKDGKRDGIGIEFIDDEDQWSENRFVEEKKYIDGFQNSLDRDIKEFQRTPTHKNIWGKDTTESTKKEIEKRKKTLANLKKEYEQALANLQTISFYIGEFKDGKKNGDIKVYKLGHLIFEGDYKDDKANGEAKVYFPNGNLFYEGEMKDNNFEGKGKLYYESGQLQYEGEFAHGKFNGEGTEYTENGEIDYEGEWEEGHYAE